MSHRFPAGLAALCALPLLAAVPAASAADELLETLARKGVITMEEYEKLKARVSYLEAEIVKKDALIKDLQNK